MRSPQVAQTPPPVSSRGRVNGLLAKPVRVAEAFVRVAEADRAAVVVDPVVEAEAVLAASANVGLVVAPVAKAVKGVSHVPNASSSVPFTFSLPKAIPKTAPNPNPSLSRLRSGLPMGSRLRSSMASRKELR